MRLVAAAAILLTAGASHAYVPASEPPVVTVGAPVRAARGVVSAPRVPGWQAFADRETGVIARMWGGRSAAPGASGDAAIAERAARAFLAAHAAALAPGEVALELVANRVDGGLRTVAFRQRWRGLRVVGGQAHVVIARDHVIAAGSEILPHVTAAGAGAPRATAARAEAWLRAETGLAATVRPTGERVVLPLVRGPGDVAFRVVDALEGRAPGGARWDVYVAPDGAPVARRSRIAYASGRLRYDAPVRHPGGARAPVDAAHANVVVDGVAGVTGGDGGFAWAGDAPALVEPGLIGPFVYVYPAAGAPAAAQLIAPPGDDVVWREEDELADAQVSAFAFATIGKARARAMFPGLAWLDAQLWVQVNQAGECNAYASGDAIHFYRASAACENTARLADVVLHEFAHALHAHAAIPGAGVFEPGALAEGVADFFAAHVAGDAGVGRGMYFDDAPVRDLAALRVFPLDVSASPHDTGVIVGGALWDLRAALRAAHGPAAGDAAIERIFAGVLQRASDLPSAYVAALVADDDDGDLGNGTPNRCAIEAAFGRHGLAGPAYRTTEVAPPVLDGWTVRVAVDTPPAAPCAPPQVAAMELTWRTGGDAHAIAMTRDGDAWTAALPAQPDGTTLRYRIRATLDDGATVARPDNAADPEYEVFVGAGTEIWCERFDAHPRWEQRGDREWEWGAPVAGSPGRDPPAAYSGTHVLGTNLTGDGRYRPGITTVLEAPPIDVAGYAHVRLRFRRWLAIEDGRADVATVQVDGATLWRNAASPDGSLDHVDREWRLVDLALTPRVGAPVTVAWTLTSDAATELGGWSLDDVCLVGFDPLPEPEPEVVEPGGCCAASGDPGGAWLALALLWGRQRRRRCSSSVPSTSRSARMP